MNGASSRGTERRFRIGKQTYLSAEARAGIVLIVPTLLFMAFTYLLPVVRVVQLSFTNFDMIKGAGTFTGLKNYTYIFEDEDFWLSLLNTCKYAVVKLSIDTVLALILAVMLDGNIPCKRFLRSSFFAPVVVPVVASSIIWIWFYNEDFGPLNAMLGMLGMGKMSWLSDDGMALWCILAFSVWKGVGYNMVLFLSGLQNIPDSYLEAARMDGASETRAFFSIKLPLLKPITSFIIMMGVINSFKVFSEINVMMRGADKLGSPTSLTVNYIYQQAFTNGKMGRACAAALVLFIIIFVFTQLQRRMNAHKTIDLV